MAFVEETLIKSVPQPCARKKRKFPSSIASKMYGKKNILTKWNLQCELIVVNLDTNCYRIFSLVRPNHVM